MRRGLGNLLGVAFLGYFALSPVSLGARESRPAQHWGTFKLAVDATQTPRQIFRAVETIPVHEGALTLEYPKWLPGEHMPTGPITNLIGLHFMAGGHDLPWHRDDVNMYAFHVEIPKGVASLEVKLAYVPVDAGQNFSSGSSTSDKLAVLNWNQVLLSPEGTDQHDVKFDASLKLPEGWKFGTALPGAAQTGDTVTFTPVMLNTLVDSPVLIGEYFRKIDLTPGEHPDQEIDMAADSEEALDMPPDMIQHYKNLVAQAYALFRTRHYADYHFLLTLSDHVASFGLEHHQSSDDRVRENTLTDPSARLLRSGLLPHEYVHSWNGKFRRPEGLLSMNYQQPMRDELLWVYEGLTQYLGSILTARSGLWTSDQYRQSLAGVAASLDHRYGRTWRSLQDTATSAPFLYDAPGAWSNWRRGVDFYDEDILIWLDADVTIRQITGGAKSLNDFCRLFHGGPDGVVALKPYNFDDVVKAMNEIVPYNWREFFRSRLDRTGSGAPLEGITNSGWKLEYSDTPAEMIKDAQSLYHGDDEILTVGCSVSKAGEIQDVVPQTPADGAGLAPGMKIVAVNMQQFSTALLRDAVKASKSGGALDLLVENDGYFRTCRLDYHAGAKYPVLVRDESKPDVLDEILKALPAYR